MEIEGVITKYIGEQSGVSKAGNAWKKREYVMEYMSGQYPRMVKFTIFGNRCDTINIEVGKRYVVSYDIESREFNDRWYTDVNCYAVRESNGMEQPGGYPQGGYGQPGAYPQQGGYGQPYPPQGGFGAPQPGGFGAPQAPQAPADGPFGPQPAAPAAPAFDPSAGGSDDLPF